MPQTNETLSQLRLQYAAHLRPCPKCGTYNVPVGEYEDRWELLREGARLAARLPREQLSSLLADLRLVETGERTPAELAATAPNDVVRKFWDFLPSTRNELYAFVTALAAIIAILVSVLKDDDSSGATPEQIEQIIDSVIDKAHHEPPAPSAPSPTEQLPTPPSPSAAAPARHQPLAGLDQAARVRPAEPPRSSEGH